MAAESLAALGLELRAEAAAWLAALTPDALPDGTQAARELFQALGELEAEVADAAADEVELTRLQAWLTSGFFAAPEPFAPADAVVAEVIDEARRRDAEDSAAPVPGANAFAAGNSQSPPARTAAAGPLPHTGEVADPLAPADAHRATDHDPRGSVGVPRASVDDGREGWVPTAPDLQGARQDDAPLRIGPDREAVDEGPGAPPSPGSIQGLAALATLAGSGGVEIPAPREDADHPPHTIEQPRGASARAAVEPDLATHDRPAYRVDAYVADANSSPVRRSAADDWPSASAERSAEPAAEAGPVREVDRGEVGAVQLPPRIIRIPFTPPVERAEDADAGWTTGTPLPIPFLTTPGETEQDAAPGGSAAPTAEARPPLALRPMRLFDGAAESAMPTPDARPPESMPTPDARSLEAMPTPDARPAEEAEWPGFEAPRESAEAFLARAARVAGKRLRPAAEIVGDARAPAAPAPLPAPAESAPGARPIGSSDAARPDAYPIVPANPAEADPYPTVLAREVVPAERPVEGVEWPAPDVTDLLDALASEIAHEYRRYYGE